MKKLLTISLAVLFIFAGIAYWIFGSMDRWMISILSDNVQVGLYSVAFKFASIVLFINTAFGKIMDYGYKR